MPILDPTNPDSIGVYSILPTGREVRRADVPLAQYLKYDAACARQARFKHWQQTIHIVRGNAGELERFLARVAGLAPVLEMFQTDLDPLLLEGNRHLLNLLSAGRTFDDHTRATLSRELGASAKDAFAAAASKMYDAFFNYRFLSRVRNYTQHCGFPIQHIQHEGRRDAQNSVSHTITLSFRLDFLLRDYSGWNTVGPEMAAMPPELPLESQGTEYASHFVALHETAIDLQREQMVEACNTIRTVLKAAEGLDGTPCVGQVVPEAPGFSGFRYQQPYNDILSLFP